LAPRAIGERIESDVRGFKLSRARTSAYWDRLHGGTDPERDEKFESVLLSEESANSAKRLDTGKLSSGSEEDQKF